MIAQQLATSSHLAALWTLALNPQGADQVVSHLGQLDEYGRKDLLSLANAHHVPIRALRHLQARSDIDPGLMHWVAISISSEQSRIEKAIEILHAISIELSAADCPITVIKTLDHWPDLGNDIDLYTEGNYRAVVGVLSKKFGAQLIPQSWGDRLASKWAFKIYGLPEEIEVHINRLGQTGEHTALARRFARHTVTIVANGYKFQVPAPGERILAATMQRMYRHFCIRICDIANTVALVESDEVDFDELCRVARLGNIWPGVATYLKIVSDYVKQYRGEELRLPAVVSGAALFGNEDLFVRNRFPRIPLVPRAAQLYTRQITQTVLRGDFTSSLRLSLLPPLAIAATVAYWVTGSNRGIW